MRLRNAVAAPAIGPAAFPAVISGGARLEATAGVPKAFDSASAGVVAREAGCRPRDRAVGAMRAGRKVSCYKLGKMKYGTARV